MTIEKVGVIGAGQMGNGIAHVCALAGYDVLLQDIDSDNLKKAIDTITYNLTRQVTRGIIKDEDRDKALKRIVPVNDLAAFSDVDLVIEAATEKEEVKRAIFEQLCPALH